MLPDGDTIILYCFCSQENPVFKEGTIMGKEAHTECFLLKRVSGRHVFDLVPGFL